MDLDDIRAYATATERIAYQIERAGTVPALELLEVVNAATRNPVLGFGMMCGLASRAGIDFYGIEGVGETLAKVELTSGADLDPADQGAYTVAYVQAENASAKADEPVSVREASEELGVTRGRVHQLIKSGKLERLEGGDRLANGRGEVSIRRGSLDALIRERSRAFVTNADGEANESYGPFPFVT